MPNTIFDLGGELTVDTTQLSSLADEAQGQLEKIDGQEVRARVNVDDAQARSAISSVELQTKALTREIEKPKKLKVDTSGARAEMGAWRQQLHAEIFGPLDQDMARLEEKVKDAASPSPAGGSLTGRTGMMVGGGMMAGGLAAAGMIASSALKSAYSSSQMEKSVEQVFGAAAGTFEDEAEAMADAAGFMTKEIEASQIAMNKTAAQVGLDASAIQPMVKLAGNLALSSGLPQYANNISATTGAIDAALKGTSDALLDFGISMDTVQVMSIPANAAFRALGDAITPAQEAQARYNYLVEQSAKVAADAARSADESSQKMLRFSSAMEGAKEAVGEALIPIANTIADFVAAIPEPLLKASVWAGLGAAMATAIGGAIIGLNALIVAIRSLGRQATASAAETALGGGGGKGLLGDLLGKGKGLLGKGTQAGKELAAGGAAGGGILARLAAAMPGASGVGSLAGGIAGGGVLAAPAIVGAGLLLKYGSNMQKNAEEQLARDMEAGRKHDILVAKQTGMGDINDPEQAAYIARSWKYINGQLASFNVYGQRLSSNIEKWQASERAHRGGREGAVPVQARVNVTIQDRTAAGVKASQIDSGSNSPSAY